MKAGVGGWVVWEGRTWLLLASLKKEQLWGQLGDRLITQL